MKATLINMIPVDSKAGRMRSANECLEEMKSEGFESVIVHGFKNGNIYTKVSATRSALEILGALEAAKVQCWER